MTKTISKQERKRIRWALLGMNSRERDALVHEVTSEAAKEHPQIDHIGSGLVRNTAHIGPFGARELILKLYMHGFLDVDEHGFLDTDDAD